jgi:hypothetical protein
VAQLRLVRSIARAVNTKDTFLWLLWQSYAVPLYFWQVSLVVGGIALITIAVGWRGLLRLSLRSWCILASAYLVPFLILFWGALMRYEGIKGDAPIWRVYIVGALLLLFLFVSLLSICRFAGSRLVAVGILLPSAWLSLCAAFIAGMSLTNDWI